MSNWSALQSRLNAACMAAFGDSIVLNGLSVNARFDDSYSLSTVGYSSMAGTQPMLILATADVPANPVGKTAVVGATTYLVSTHEPDGNGMSRLLLQAAA